MAGLDSRDSDCIKYRVKVCHESEKKVHVNILKLYILVSLSDTVFLLTTSGVVIKVTST